ncbi:MAG: diiron oxygenase [Acidimicrobiales bacterium]
MPTASYTSQDVERKVNRLSAAAARRIVEPDSEVTGAVGSGQIIPDELLTIAGLDLDLSPAERATLATEEVASITEAGLRFEAVLEAGFSAHLALARDLTDPRITFILHEVGEETRHQRLFQRLLSQLQSRARQPVPFCLFRLGYRAVIEAAITHKAFFYTLVLAGEEIPDLFQKIAAESPATDPFIRDLNRYHRMEEARHLSFARTVLPEVWSATGRLDRALVRRLAPLMIRFMFDSMVHPGVYPVVGLPAWRTWRGANRTPQRVAMRHAATRPIVAALQDAGAFKGARIPSAWRSLAGVPRRAQPPSAAV